MESTMELNGFKITEAGDVITDLFKYRDTYNQKGKYDLATVPRLGS